MNENLHSLLPISQPSIFTISVVYLLFMIGFQLMQGCKPIPKHQGPGSAFLQGNWEEDSSLLKTDVPRKNRTFYSFRFRYDSVYVVLKTKALHRYEDDNCFTGDSYMEYQKGVYEVKNDSLFITGVYTHSNFRMKVSGCFRNGNFSSLYLFKSDTLSPVLKLRNTDEHGLIFLRKTKE